MSWVCLIAAFVPPTHETWTLADWEIGEAYVCTGEDHTYAVLHVSIRRNTFPSTSHDALLYFRVQDVTEAMRILDTVDRIETVIVRPFGCPQSPGELIQDRETWIADAFSLRRASR